MKFKRLSNTQGINKHKHWEADLGKKGKIIINSNEDVWGNKYYLTPYEGSDTRWYATPKNAAKAYLQLGQGALLKH